MIDATTYNITVRKGTFEGEVYFEARIAELPDVAEYAESYEEAYALAIDTIEGTAEIFAKQGRIMPSPIIPARDFTKDVEVAIKKLNAMTKEEFLESLILAGYDPNEQTSQHDDCTTNQLNRVIDLVNNFKSSKTTSAQYELFDYVEEISS